MTTQQTRRAGAIVIAGAPVAATQRLVSRLRAMQRPFVVAADGGAATAARLGLTPDVVVGDFDSISAKRLQELAGRGIGLERFPRDKNFTDGDLAITRALQEQPAELLLVGFVGGRRLDQTLSAFSLIQRLPGLGVLLDDSNECVYLVGPVTRSWAAEPGETVSLLAQAADASGITLQGVRWPLADSTLGRGETRGLSNEPTASRVELQLEQGSIYLVRHFA